MSQSLHHTFDVNVAQKYGIAEAILIHHFQHWISINVRLKRNFYEGRYWSYQTLDEIAANFTYLNKSQVFDLLERLCLGKSRFSKKEELDFEPVLIKGNFNKSKYDRTIWYAFCDFPKWILGNPNIEIGDPQNQDCENPTPIPDTKTICLNKEDTKVSYAQTDSRLRKEDKIAFSFDNKKFENITEKDLEVWKQAYPACNVTQEMLRMQEWCLSNTSKAKTRSKWRKFITNWLSNANDKAIGREAYASNKIDRRQRYADGKVIENPLEGVF